MIIKLLGILDIVAAVIILFFFWNFVSPVWIAIAAGYFLVKGWAFFLMAKDFASVIDIGVGLLLFIAAFVTLPTIFFVITVIWIIQKAAFSFI